MQHQIPTTIKTNLVQQTLDTMIKVLVTYASAHETTKSIAERIHSHISTSNIGPFTISKINKNPHFGDFDVIIIGS
jgi:menaquinone-dependent protoporphyrinogen IX oxidase